MLPSLAESIRCRDSSPAAQTCSTSAVHVPPCTRQAMQDDAACSAVSENQLFSLAKLTGMLATGAEPLVRAAVAAPDATDDTKEKGQRLLDELGKV